MGPRTLALLLAVGSVAGAVPARADSSIRCEGGIVSVGDSKIDLLGKCGKPALVEERLEKQRGAFPGEKTISAVETWTYNFGPNRFLQFVTVVSGRVATVERGGYGYDPERLRERTETGRARCDTGSIRLGDSKFDLLAKCGEPALVDSKLEERVWGTWTVAFQVETWTYDFGPQSFVQFAILEYGRVVRVERGGYGYAR